MTGSAQEVASEPRTLAATASTAVPALVPYSGIAIDAQGKPLGESVSVTFQIFKDEQGGDSLFTETQTLNVDRLGHFKAQLGATYPSGIPLETFQSGEARWLEVQIAGLTPKSRTLLTSVPYALKAGDSTTLGGLPVSAFALAGDTSHSATAQSVQPASSPSGTVTSVGSGAGLTGGPITKSGTLSIATGGVTNAMLHESTLTIKPGAGLIGGGSVSLGGSTTLSLAPNVYGVSGAFYGSGFPVLSGDNTDGASGHLGTTVGGEQAGVWGSSNYYGVYGTGTFGVYGTGSNIGVYAAGNIGVSAISNSSGGWGEIGTTVNGWATGVYGTSKTYGVFGTAPTYGVVGEATYTGVYGQGSTYGVFSDGPYGTSSTSAALSALPDNRVVELYSMASPENWFEDFGSGSLTAGFAEITLDPTFAQAANSESGYHVFITPNGDCEGLYVATRTATGFEVRELRSGKSNVSFDFRIVAKRRGYEALRMEEINHDAKTAQLIRNQAKNRSTQRTLILDQPAQPKALQSPSIVKPPNGAPAM
jgi:hypothetical protein